MPNQKRTTRSKSYQLKNVFVSHCHRDGSM